MQPSTSSWSCAPPHPQPCAFVTPTLSVRLPDAIQQNRPDAAVTLLHRLVRSSGRRSTSQRYGNSKRQLRLRLPARFQKLARERLARRTSRRESWLGARTASCAEGWTCRRAWPSRAGACPAAPSQTHTHSPATFSDKLSVNSARGGCPAVVTRPCVFCLPVRSLRPTRPSTSAFALRGHAKWMLFLAVHYSDPTLTASRQPRSGRRRTFFLATLSARLSLPTLSSSMIRFSYGAGPATSRTSSRIIFTRLPRRCHATPTHPSAQFAHTTSKASASASSTRYPAPSGLAVVGTRPQPRSVSRGELGMTLSSTKPIPTTPHLRDELHRALHWVLLGGTGVEKSVNRSCAAMRTAPPLP